MPQSDVGQANANGGRRTRPGWSSRLAALQNRWSGPAQAAGNATGASRFVPRRAAQRACGRSARPYRRPRPACGGPFRAVSVQRTGIKYCRRAQPVVAVGGRRASSTKVEGARRAGVSGPDVPGAFAPGNPAANGDTVPGSPGHAEIPSGVTRCAGRPQGESMRGGGRRFRLEFS